MMLISGVIYEEVKVFGSPNSNNPEAARSRSSDYWACARTWSKHGTDLSVALQIREYGCSLMKRLKELDAENTRPKKMYAEERIKAELR